eukprot:jgi/Psemu1/304190/fgenesh1_kg.139_\
MGFKATKQLPAKAIKQKSKRKRGKTERKKMTSNFLQNAAPSSIHQTYKHLSEIKPNKTAEGDRNRRRDPNAIFKHVEEIALKTVHKNGFQGKFMATNWGRTTVGEKKYSLAQAVSIDSFKTVDSTDKKFVLAFAKSEPSLRIFAKASRQFAKQRLGTPKNIEITRTFAGQIVQSKPKIGRGTKCDSVNTNLEQKALHIVKEMQLCLTPMSKLVNLEMTVMNEVVNRTTLNAIGHHTTAFSIGKDYHSKSHTDVDMFYTRLTVIAPKHVSDDEVIYYFVFPTYKVKVPLRSGDTLLFNPLVLYSCSNPKFEGCYIMSAYVSRKTVLRANPLS